LDGLIKASVVQRYIRFQFPLAVITVVSVILMSTHPNLAWASEPVEFGYRDFPYPSGTGGDGHPTGEKPESKLWWHDGFWWGSLWSNPGSAYQIFKLDMDSQSWKDTGVVLDPRLGSKADVLWDGQHLYVVSHIYTTSGQVSSNQDTWGRLYRYSYDALAKTYSLDNGFPVTVTRGPSETLVVAKDSTGLLWVTYTQKDAGDKKFKVWVNHSTEDDASWGTPYVLPILEASNLYTDDIASIVTYQGNIGVMWSNQNTHKMYFAVHADGSSDQAWQVAGAYTASADDHISLKALKADSSGKVFAVVKTSYSETTQPLIVLLVCTSGSCYSTGDWTYHVVYRVGEGSPTRPILLLDTDQRNIYVLVATEGGGVVSYKVSSIDSIQFHPGLGTTFIKSGSDAHINDPTSTKQNLGCDTGLAVLASDSYTHYYLHNAVNLCSNPPTPTMTPTATSSPTPTQPPTYTSTPTVIPTSSATPTSTHTPTHTPLPTATHTPSYTPTDTSTPTSTAIPTDTPQSTVTHTPTFTPSPGFTSEATVTFTPTPTTSFNLPPVAAAGLDQVVQPGARVQLDGSASEDQDGNLPLSYAWTQTSGPSIMLSSTHVVSPVLTAPGFPATLTFDLVVTDSLNTASEPDSVSVTIVKPGQSDVNIVYLPLISWNKEFSIYAKRYIIKP
jgi:hypothetical protein